MGLSDRRLTGRDVLAKTFHAKTKRGYDPIEVDAYLELVAAQIDVLHGDIGRVTSEAAVQAPPVAPAPIVGEPSQELQAELEELLQQHGELASELTQEQAVSESLRAENEQLRMQLTAIAPPPPVVETQPVVEAAAPVNPVSSNPVQAAATGNERAEEESYELVLRMAHRTAEETISQAHARADEIVAEAEFNSAQISKESDRKAFEAANRVQSEIAALSAEIDVQRHELASLNNEALGKKQEMRGLANSILLLADVDSRRFEGAEVVDLRAAQANSVPSDAEA